jgi:Glycosyltransferase Family 4
VQILAGTQQLSWIGGANTYVVTVCEQLERLGHDVLIFAAEPGGEMTEVARARGLRVVEPGRGLPLAPDVIYAQDAYASLLLAELYSLTPQVFATHADEYDISLPPQLPGLIAAVVACHDRVARRAQAAAVGAELVRLRQPVDTVRFSPRGPLSDPPRRALLLGNYLSGDRRELVIRACADAGIECEQVGAQNGRWTTEPEALMSAFDIVFGKARVIVEAMACGRAAYVYDHNGGDGWVVPETYELLEADNFGGQAEGAGTSYERLRGDLAAYRPDMGPANRDLAVANHSANKHAQELVELFGRVAPRTDPVDAPLRELARLVRIQAGIDHRAQTLAAEAHGARARTLELEDELSDTRRRLAELDERVGGLEEEARAARADADELMHQRRVRFALALARPLDALRRRG